MSPEDRGPQQGSRASIEDMFSAQSPHIQSRRRAGVERGDFGPQKTPLPQRVSRSLQQNPQPVRDSRRRAIAERQMGPSSATAVAEMADRKFHGHCRATTDQRTPSHSRPLLNRTQDAARSPNSASRASWLVDSDVPHGRVRRRVPSRQISNSREEWLGTSGSSEAELFSPALQDLPVERCPKRPRLSRACASGFAEGKVPGKHVHIFDTNPFRLSPEHGGSCNGVLSSHSSIGSRRGTGDPEAGGSNIRSRPCVNRWTNRLKSASLCGTARGSGGCSEDELFGSLGTRSGLSSGGSAWSHPSNPFREPAQYANSPIAEPPAPPRMLPLENAPAWDKSD